MIGLVLAAGVGSRLGDLTATVPKCLLPVAEDLTLLDCIAMNFRAVGIDRAVVVTGFGVDLVREHVGVLRRRFGLKVDLIYNDRSRTANNAYSLWLARGAFQDGVMLCNGDTLHPVTVQERLIGARGAPILLAVDDRKDLGQEEMKVRLAADGRLDRISKSLDPGVSDGEYIGVAVLEAAARTGITASLEATWQSDPTLYYEDGIQAFVDDGGPVAVAAIGVEDWVEVDTPDDLARAREIAPAVLRAERARRPDPNS